MLRRIDFTQLKTNITMIKENMFFTEPTIKDYRDMKLDDVLREFLLYKGTWDEDGEPTNKKVTPKALCDSALYVYGLKSNPTNKRAVIYYCEREARARQIMDGDTIKIPTDLWEKCDKYNKTYCGKEKQDENQ